MLPYLCDRQLQMAWLRMCIIEAGALHIQRPSGSIFPDISLRLRSLEGRQRGADRGRETNTGQGKGRQGLAPSMVCGGDAGLGPIDGGVSQHHDLKKQTMRQRKGPYPTKRCVLYTRSKATRSKCEKD